jgi:hypothetical protein
MHWNIILVKRKVNCLFNIATTTTATTQHHHCYHPNIFICLPQYVWATVCSLHPSYHCTVIPNVTEGDDLHIWRVAKSISKNSHRQPLRLGLQTCRMGIVLTTLHLMLQTVMQGLDISLLWAQQCKFGFMKAREFVGWLSSFSFSVGPVPLNYLVICRHKILQYVLSTSSRVLTDFLNVKNPLISSG